MASGSDDFLKSSMPDELVEIIQGNAPRHIKEIPLKWLAIFRSRPGSFSNSITNSIAKRVKVVEVSLKNNPDDPALQEGRMVAEIDVTEGGGS
jgi:acyl-coenzyme A thioesterase 13